MTGSRCSLPALDNPGAVGPHILTVSTGVQQRTFSRFWHRAGGFGPGGLSLSSSDDAPRAPRRDLHNRFHFLGYGGAGGQHGHDKGASAGGDIFAGADVLQRDEITVTDLTTNVSNTTASMCFSEVGTKGRSRQIPSPVGIVGTTVSRWSYLIWTTRPVAGTHSLTIGTSSDGARSVDYTVTPPAHALTGLLSRAADLAGGAGHAGHVHGPLHHFCFGRGSLPTRGRSPCERPGGHLPLCAPLLGDSLATITDLCHQGLG